MSSRGASRRGRLPASRSLEQCLGRCLTSSRVLSSARLCAFAAAIHHGRTQHDPGERYPVDPDSREYAAARATIDAAVAAHRAGLTPVPNQMWRGGVGAYLGDDLVGFGDTSAADARDAVLCCDADSQKTCVRRGARRAPRAPAPPLLVSTPGLLARERKRNASHRSLVLLTFAPSPSDEASVSLSGPARHKIK